MARIVFVTGGARSGKSRFAQRIAEAWEGPLLYVATAEVLDDEMADRVRRHRADRGPRWETLEEPLDLPAALRAAEGFGGALVDCLTLWVSNLLGRWGGDEAGLAAALDRFYRALEAFRGRICLVTNEVGSGIVPENALARRFRDLAGRVNQECAARAHEAYLVVSGLPVRLK
ncbi:MAG: bifunctional adenosylcobinamide kinase/adenosylcobinamide-phosphate guanylyltransferase [Candidatus Dadabacteria bacterium]|nr:MAG: bifunctional adenosylcobinamide kinase/adenosylcobinamide-phosphate guanylyltransferase [Candidatus Dadabacteria bacterium]